MDDKKIKLLYIVGLVAIITLGGVLYQRSKTEETIQSNLTTPGPEKMPAKPESDSLSKDSRPCLVLQDNVDLLTDYKVNPSASNPTLHASSGKILNMTGLEQDDATKKTWYKADFSDIQGNHTQWLNSTACLLFDDQGLFDNFLSSSGDASLSWDRSSDTSLSVEERNKYKILMSPEFKNRVLANKDADPTVIEWAHNQLYPRTNDENGGENKGGK